jgi:long-chain acyl-CoA synthetase
VVDFRRFYTRIPDRRYEDFRAFLDGVAARGGDKPAFRWRPGNDEEERSTSFAALKRQADGLASALLAAGLAAGDRVGLLSENRPEWCVTYLAVVAAGLVIVPLDISLDDAGVLNNLGAAHCRALCLSGKQRKRRSAALTPSAMAALGTKLVLDMDEEVGAESWALAASTPPSSRLPRPGEIGAAAEAVVFFTSGTTGFAKGIVLDHGAVIENVNASRMSLLVDEEDVFVALLPLHHTYATTCSFLSGIEAGCTVAIVDRIAPTAVLKAIRDCGVTFVIGVPLLFDKIRSGIEANLALQPQPARLLLTALLGASRYLAVGLGLRLGRPLFGFLRAKAGLSTVRLAVSGGGPLSPATADFFDAIGINLVQGYGMSENGPLISVNLPEYKDNASVGFPVKRTELRINDPGPDGIGEIEVRSPSLMKGYLGAPEATAEVFTEDGWLRTGDLGRIDRRGLVYITGRRKNLIITEGGKNVYPEELEGRLDLSPWIKECLVLGRPARPGVQGEDVVAIVVPDLDAIRAEHGMAAEDGAFVSSLIHAEMSLINRSLPGYMKIVDLLIREEEFEKTSSGKIRRFLYRSQAPALR